MKVDLERLKALLSDRSSMRLSRSELLDIFSELEGLREKVKAANDLITFSRNEHQVLQQRIAELEAEVERAKIAYRAVLGGGEE